MGLTECSGSGILYYDKKTPGLNEFFHEINRHIIELPTKGGVSFSPSANLDPTGWVYFDQDNYDWYADSVIVFFGTTNLKIENSNCGLGRFARNHFSVYLRAGLSEVSKRVKMDCFQPLFSLGLELDD